MDDNYFKEAPTTSLTFWALGHMLRGAGLAFVLILGLAVIFGITWGIGHFLPEQSKTMPSPFGALELVEPSLTAEV
jgi:Intrinsic membrane protein PufX